MKKLMILFVVFLLVLTACGKKNWNQLESFEGQNVATVSNLSQSIELATETLEDDSGQFDTEEPAATSTYKAPQTVIAPVVSQEPTQKATTTNLPTYAASQSPYPIDNDPTKTPVSPFPVPTKTQIKTSSPQVTVTKTPTLPSPRETVTKTSTSPSLVPTETPTKTSPPQVTVTRTPTSPSPGETVTKTSTSPSLVPTDTQTKTSPPQVTVTITPASPSPTRTATPTATATLTLSPTFTATPISFTWSGDWHIWYQNATGKYVQTIMILTVIGDKVFGNATIDGVAYTFEGIITENNNVSGEWRTATRTVRFWWEPKDANQFLGSWAERFGFCGNKLEAVQPEPCMITPTL